MSLLIPSISVCQKILQQVFKSYLENGSGDLSHDYSCDGLLHSKFIGHWLWDLGVKRIHRTMDMFVHKSIDFSFIQQKLNQCN